MKLSYKQKYEALLKEFEQYKKESVKWSVEDFTWEEKEGWSIDEQQAQEALEDMIKHHDAGIGISWETIDWYIEKYGTEAREGEELWRKRKLFE